VPVARVEAERHAPYLLARALPQLDEAGDERHRQVVDAVEPQVLEHLDGAALARAGEAGHHGQAQPLGHMILGARPLLGRCAPCAAPMPPDPVGRHERSRARPPTTSGSLTRYSGSPARRRRRLAISSSMRSAKSSAPCWPRLRRRWLSAAGLFPIPLLPRMRTPRPCISTRSPWRLTSGAMRSSSQAVVLRMKSAVRSAEPSTATPAASAGSVNTAGGGVSLVTTKHATP